LMNGQNLLDRLELHDDPPGEQDIDVQLAIEIVFLVEDRDLCLSGEFDAALPKLVTQASFIDGLEQPRPEGPMDLDRGPDDRRSNRVVVFTPTLIHEPPPRLRN